MKDYNPMLESVVIFSAFVTNESNKEIELHEVIDISCSAVPQIK